MRQQDLVRNPFILMLDPQQVLAAVERSEKLGRLNRRMCHPLDRPVQVPSDAGSSNDEADQREERLEI